MQYMRVLLICVFVCVTDRNCYLEMSSNRSRRKEHVGSDDAWKGRQVDGAVVVVCCHLLANTANERCPSTLLGQRTNTNSYLISPFTPN